MEQVLTLSYVMFLNMMIEKIRVNGSGKSDNVHLFC